MMEMGYWGLFVASFLSATIVPFSSEALLSGMLIAGFDPYKSIAVATAGNWLGSMSSYALGYLGNISRIERWLRISAEKTEKYRHISEKYGSWFGLIVWLPGIGDVIAVCLGLVRAPIVQTTITIFVGKAARYIAWGYLTIKGIDLFS